MYEKKHNTVGALYAVSSNGDYLRKPSGAIKTWASYSGAGKAAIKLGGKVVSLLLTQVEYYEPTPVMSEEVLELINQIKSLYESGIPRTTICMVEQDIQANIVRHRPLGTDTVMKNDVQVGDQDAIVELRIKFYADIGSMQKLKENS